MSFNVYHQTELNRVTHQTNQKVWLKFWMYAEDVLRWLVHFIGSMVSMYRGK